MTDFILFLASAVLLMSAMIGAAVFFMVLIIFVAEFCRDLKEDLRRRKEIREYEKNKTSEEKSAN